MNLKYSKINVIDKVKEVTMFIHEESPVWDVNKARIIGVENGSFCFNGVEINQRLPYEWYKMIGGESDEILGYGWVDVDTDNQESELSLCVAEEHRGKGIAKQMLMCLEEKIIENNFPVTIIATIKGSNTHSEAMMHLLQSQEYMPMLDFETTKNLLRAGQNGSFYKDLSI